MDSSQACSVCGQNHAPDIKTRHFLGCVTDAEREREREAVERVVNHGD